MTIRITLVTAKALLPGIIPITFMAPKMEPRTMTKKVDQEMSLGDLDEVNGGVSISDLRAEAAAKQDSTMSAATTQLTTGNVAGALTSAGSAFTSSAAIGFRGRQADAGHFHCSVVAVRVGHSRE